MMGWRRLLRSGCEPAHYAQRATRVPTGRNGLESTYFSGGGVMTRGMWTTIRGGLLIWALMLIGVPAFAQADFSGTWGARYQEDFPERIPGPDLGDYLGLPINPSARQFADSWDPSRITLRKSSAACTSPRTSIAVRSTCASGKSAIRTRRNWSPSSTTSAPTIRRGRFTWTAVRTPPKSRRTPGRVSRPASGMATCWSLTRPTSSRDGFGGTVCRSATRRR